MRWLLLASLALVGCSGPVSHYATGHDPLPDQHRVSSEQAMRLLLNGALLVDVSDRVVYYGRHVRGAYNVPWDELERRVSELPVDRPIVIYSRDGAHAADCDLFLRARGYDVHLLGSFEDWSGG